MKIRLAGCVNNSMKDGLGLRKVIFCQGCKHNCEGCFNSHTHNFEEGEVVDTKDIIENINNDFIIDGVTFSGGDPFEQAEAFAEIAKGIKDKNIWCYTGYTLKQIMDGIENGNIHWKELLSKIDVLVDGKFDLNKKDTTNMFRGSTNQHIIIINKIRLHEQVSFMIKMKRDHENIIIASSYKEALDIIKV